MALDRTDRRWRWKLELIQHILEIHQLHKRRNLAIRYKKILPRLQKDEGELGTILALQKLYNLLMDLF